MEKIELQKRITDENGEIIESKEFSWDPETKILLTKRSGLVFHLKGITGITIFASSFSSFIGGRDLRIKSDGYCMFFRIEDSSLFTEEKCVFSIVQSCNVQTGDYSTVNTVGSCNINMGDNSMAILGSGGRPNSNVEAGNNCVIHSPDNSRITFQDSIIIHRLDIKETLVLKESASIQLNSNKVSGYKEANFNWTNHFTWV